MDKMQMVTLIKQIKNHAIAAGGFSDNAPLSFNMSYRDLIILEVPKLIPS